MPAVWFALKRSFDCKTEPSEVHDPKANSHLNPILTRKPTIGSSGCSRSISNLRDVLHGSKRHTEKPPPSGCSPRSIASSEILNPLTHEVILNEPTNELKITGFGGNNYGPYGKKGSSFKGTLKEGTFGPRAHSMQPHHSARMSTTPRRKSPLGHGGNGGGSDTLIGSNINLLKSRAFLETDSNRYSNLICQKCGEQLKGLEAVEVHHLSKHSVTELAEGDSSRKVVEIICRPSWSNKSEDNRSRQIERVLKVHNMQKTLAQFEEYREMVKIRANKLAKKHPRCLADGNELLRFYGTVAACSLGTNGSSSLCTLNQCGVCRVLRHGFSTKKESNGVGIFTTSTSGRALESVEVNGENKNLRRALIVCRVIAGRVHRPLETQNELKNPSGFDSLAGKVPVGRHSSIEELYLLNPKALLPCFVVICRPLKKTIQ